MKREKVWCAVGTDFPSSVACGDTFPSGEGFCLRQAGGLGSPFGRAVTEGD
ncbi:MAG: hypothetical protein IJD20_03715 [Oscillospiraceae bacterium]|nr:hypothetical protein [Oscillospiraceae bacterium]